MAASEDRAARLARVAAQCGRYEAMGADGTSGVYVALGDLQWLSYEVSGLWLRAEAAEAQVREIRAKALAWDFLLAYDAADPVPGATLGEYMDAAQAYAVDYADDDRRGTFPSMGHTSELKGL